MLLCDLLLVYSAHSVHSQPTLHALALSPSDPLRSEMAAYLIDYIFTDDPQNDPPDGIPQSNLTAAAGPTPLGPSVSLGNKYYVLFK